MKEKKVLLARTKEEKHRKNRILVVGSGFFILLSAITIALYSLRSVNDNALKPASADKMLIEIDQNRPVNKMRAESSGVPTGIPEPTETLNINDLFPEIVSSMPAFSTDFNDLSDAVDAYNMGARPLHELEEVREKAFALGNKIQAFVDDSYAKIIEAIEAGDRNTFNILKNSVAELLAYTEVKSAFNVSVFDDEIFFSAYAAMLRAQNSGDLNGELTELQKMYGMYGNDSYVQRIREINVALKNKRIEELEIRVIGAIDSKDFMVATAVVEQLEAIDPLNRNIGNYKEAIEIGIKKDGLRRSLQLGYDKLQNEEYGNANAAYKEALKINPDNSEAIQGVTITDAILDILVQLEGLNSDPRRISETNVYQYSKGLIARANQYMSYPTVAMQVNELQENIDEFTREIEVTFLSDNKSRIEIRGVGYIAPTDTKVIKLRPGRYQVNTTCPGYINNFFEIEVVDGMDSVKAVCGEKL